MTDYTCTACETSFSLAGVEGTLRCPKCGAEVAERLPDALEEVDTDPQVDADAPPAARVAPVSRGSARPTGSRATGAGRPNPTARTPARGGAPARARAQAASPAAGKPNRLPLIVGALVVVAAVGIGYVATRDKGDATPENPSSGTQNAGGPVAGTTDTAGTKSAPTPTPAPPVATGNPAVDYKNRLAQLAPGDLEGRRALASFCRENDLSDPFSEVTREILLLDSDDETSRKLLGFTRHDAAGSPFAGRWLSKADAALAKSYDSMIAGK